MLTHMKNANKAQNILFQTCTKNRMRRFNISVAVNRRSDNRPNYFEINYKKNNKKNKKQKKKKTKDGIRYWILQEWVKIGPIQILNHNSSLTYVIAMNFWNEYY